MVLIRSSLFWRLFGLVGVLAIVVGALALVSLNHLRSLHARIHWTADVAVVRLTLAADARRETLAIGQAYRDLIIAESPHELDNLAAELDRRRSVLAGLLKELGDLVEPENRVLVADANVAVDALFSQISEIESLVRYDSRARAATAFSDEAVPALKAADLALADAASEVQRLRTDEEIRPANGGDAAAADEVLPTPAREDPGGGAGTPVDGQRIAAVTTRVERLRNLLAEVLAVESDLILTESELLAEEKVRQLDVLLSATRTELQALQTVDGSPALQRAVEAAASAIERHEASAAEMVELVLADSRGQAAELASTRGRELSSRTNALLTEILSRNRAFLVIAQEETGATATAVRTAIAVVTIGGLGITLLLGGWLARRSTQRINRLVRQAELVRQTGDLSRPFHLSGRDEFAMLAESFESMRVSLLGGRRELQEAHDHLEQRVRERTLELERKNEELDQFAYVASHDLKAPLRAISNLTTWIEEDAVDQLPEHVQGYIDKLRSRVARMDRLLDDLLQYSRADRIRGEIRAVDTRRLTEDVIEVVAAPDSFRFEVAPSLPTLWTAQAPLEMVLRNLIGNAVKHARKDGGHIRVRAEKEEDGNWRFLVCDDGPGIAPEFQERVFQMFQTLRPRDEVEGSGMGLALVKKAVEARGGRVELVSAVGEGTTISFTWPEDEVPGEGDSEQGDPATSSPIASTDGGQTPGAAAARTNGTAPTRMPNASGAETLKKEPV